MHLYEEKILEICDNKHLEDTQCQLRSTIPMMYLEQVFLFLDF